MEEELLPWKSTLGTGVAPETDATSDATFPRETLRKTFKTVAEVYPVPERGRAWGPAHSRQRKSQGASSGGFNPALPVTVLHANRPGQQPADRTSATQKGGQTEARVFSPATSRSTWLHSREETAALPLLPAPFNSPLPLNDYPQKSKKLSPPQTVLAGQLTKRCPSPLGQCVCTLRVSLSGCWSDPQPHFK